MGVSFYLALWVQEGPPSLLEKALRIINDGLHDLGPVERLHPLRVLDVAGAERKESESKSVSVHSCSELKLRK